MALTNNYGFTLLNSSDTAGHTSINTCIQSIDNALDNKVNVAGMIMLFDTSLGAIPDGWVDLTASPANLPAVSGTYTYIKKSA